MTVAVRELREPGTDEWTQVAVEWIETAPQKLWRRHSDLVNTMLLERWMPREKVARILKTDLFDEVVAKGVYPMLATRGDSVLALDISPMVSIAARKRYPRLETMGADVRALPLADDSVDVIVSLSTLDHFHGQDEIHRALLELFRVLAPGGTLIMTLDNPANPIVALRNKLPYRLTHSLRLVPYPVGTTLMPRAACDAVARAGFKVDRCSAVMHAPRVAAIPAMNAADKRNWSSFQSSLLKAAIRFEKLERLPTRFLTGHFIAIRARKPTS
ncbi:MAG TPA: class I SAM-dependent methyltransferase [Gemmatimonadaceae bacterium]